MKVLGVDPGGDTGVCLIELTPDAPAEILFMEEIHNGVKGFTQWFQVYADIIVCEAFHLDGRTPKPDLQAVQIIGALTAYNSMQGANWRLVTKTNTQGKHLMTSPVLKRAGYYPKRGKVGKGHAVDSARHALNYAVSNLNHRPTQLKIFPKEED